MKTRVKTIHGKIPVTGGLNPENDLKSHEILVKENTDGTVELKERNINGEIVSVSGGSSNASGLSIPFYYTKETMDNWLFKSKDMAIGASLSYGATIPKDRYNNDLWQEYNWRSMNNSNHYTAFSYYTVFSGSNPDYYKVYNYRYSIEGTDIDYSSIENKVKANLAETVHEDIDFVFGYYTNDTMTHIIASSYLQDVVSKDVADWDYCHYNYNEQSIEYICPLAYVQGLISTMTSTDSDQPA